MPILDQGGLQKLTIRAYRRSERNRSTHIDDFEAMFNPASYSQKYEIQYGAHQSLGSGGSQQKFTGIKPVTLNLKLILDDTGVHDIGLSLLSKLDSVTQRVNKFLSLVYHLDGDIHESRYLSVQWGDLAYWGDYKFDCRLSSVNIAYTSFNKDGTALRAELDVTLVSDQDVAKLRRKENKNSPDLTHSRVVKTGDTLPLLCKEIYGKSSYYLVVAKANNLDNFRSLTPGQTLIFPPLEKS